jgi:hypothetical protein
LEWEGYRVITIAATAAAAAEGIARGRELLLHCYSPDRALNDIIKVMDGIVRPTAKTAGIQPSAAPCAPSRPRPR